MEDRPEGLDSDVKRGPDGEKPFGLFAINCINATGCMASDIGGYLIEQLFVAVGFLKNLEQTCHGLFG